MTVHVEKWLVAELTFKTTSAYKIPEQFYVVMDAIFTHDTSKKVYRIPCFWDGDSTFKVRFAPTEVGSWSFITVCETDTSLNGISGSVECTEYTGELPLYKHGFIKTVKGTKYFTYDDGTPFFYLGDTHWNMFTEEFNEPGPHAIGIETDSHFKYIVNKRIEQGFTVFQSEPLGNFHLQDGFNENSLLEFKNADQHFKFLADNGILHANAQLFFSKSIKKELVDDGNKLELMCRYWVARYQSYPVMWTLAQEMDNDMYDENHPGALWWNYTNNPWVKVAEFIHKYDAYSHPLSGHQESAIWTTVTGKGAYYPKKSDGGRSVFDYPGVSERCGHTWWASQWKHSINKLPHFESAMDYWESDKVSINYEDNYCYLWTKDYGARLRGWVSYLCGFFGYGYGCTDIWLYRSTFEMDRDANKMDGFTVVTKEEKQTPWSKALEFESAYQMLYMRKFFEKFQWWRLVPDFDKKNYFIPEGNAFYACATVSDELYVIYLYDPSNASGTVGNMDKNAEYVLQWFNPRTNEYCDEETVKANCTDENGNSGYKLPSRPDCNDWVILLKKK